jgi:hypothetical protein
MFSVPPSAAHMVAQTFINGFPRPVDRLGQDIRGAGGRAFCNGEHGPGTGICYHLLAC